jgi:hypothetical protein
MFFFMAPAMDDTLRCLGHKDFAKGQGSLQAICGLARQAKVSHPSSPQLAEAAKTGPCQADYIANSIFHLRERYRNDCVRTVAVKCYLSNRLSANL